MKFCFPILVILKIVLLCNPICLEGQRRALDKIVEHNPDRKSIYYVEFDRPVRKRAVHRWMDSNNFVLIAGKSKPEKVYQFGDYVDVYKSAAFINKKYHAEYISEMERKKSAQRESAQSSSFLDWLIPAIGLGIVVYHGGKYLIQNSGGSNTAPSSVNSIQQCRYQIVSGGNNINISSRKGSLNYSTIKVIDGGEGMFGEMSRVEEKSYSVTYSNGYGNVKTINDPFNDSYSWPNNTNYLPVKVQISYRLKGRNSPMRYVEILIQDGGSCQYDIKLR
ncbi:MAG: hypothetical protein EA409_11420 [Saprospirales bacterium]|nr:MAG: hypothetical protein EA409_11420 [Saprospirales bacterium]